MENLLLILLVLAVAMFLLVTIGERVMKPMSPEAASRLSRWLMIAVGIMLVVGVARFYL